MVAHLFDPRTVLGVSTLPHDPAGEIEELVLAALLSEDPDEQREALADLTDRIDTLPTRLRAVVQEMTASSQGEARLTYAAKAPTGLVLSTPAVPLQEWSNFGGETAPGEWRNKLIFGDNLGVLAALLRMKQRGELKNADGTDGVRVCYIDPPFATGREMEKAEVVAYRDKVEGAEFVEFLRRRLILIRELLSTDGTLYVHLDWRKSHYVKVVLDEVLGEACFLNDIIWFYPDTPGRSRSSFPKKHDSILRYSRSKGREIFNADDVRVEILAASKERYKTPRVLGGHAYVGGASAEDGKIPEDVWQISSVKGNAKENAGYPTQKPQALLERIVLASSCPGDLILDCFMGSGTTLRAAAKTGRRWIGVDCGKLAIHTATRDLLSTTGPEGEPVKPFTVYHAGLYNPEELAEKLDTAAWTTFVLDLFGASHKASTRHGVQFHGRIGRSILVHVVDPKPSNLVDSQEGHVEVGLSYLQSLVDASKPGPRTKLAVIVPDTPAKKSTGLRQTAYELKAPGAAHTTEVRVLKVPPAVTADFLALDQPGNEQAVNALIDAHGFNVAIPPDVELTKKLVKGKPVVAVKSFESNSVVRNTKSNPAGSTPADAREDLAMVLVDYEYEQDRFDFEEVVYGDDLAKKDWKLELRVEAASSPTVLMFIDRFGNEARLVLQPSDFGSQP